MGNGNAHSELDLWLLGQRLGGGAVWPGQVGLQGMVVANNPTDGQTYTIQLGSVSTVVYSFKAVPVGPADVLIGANVAATQASLEPVVIANQGSLMEAVDYGSTSPLYLWPHDPDNAITQTDGTGGNLTLYGDGVIAAAQVASAIVSPFHVQHQATAVNTTEGSILFPLPLGYEPISYSFICYNGKGVGALSLDVKACTASVAAGAYPSGQWVIELSNGGITPWINGDQIVLQGLMKKL